MHTGYAFGISLRDRHGVVGFAHSGNIIGYKAMLYLFPNDNKGFFISHNMDSETADYEGFNKVLIETLNIPKIQTDYREGVTIKGFEKWEGYYVPMFTKIEPLELFDIVGSFTKIRFKKGGLIVSPFQKKETQLIHIGNRLFQSTDRVYPSHLLYDNEQGHYLTTATSTLKKISGWKILLSAISLGLGFAGFVIILVSGIYQVIKFNLIFLTRPICWAFLSVSILLLAIIFIATKNVIFIGDKNLGSIFLYCGSIFMPILTAFSIVAFVRNNRGTIRKVGFWGTILVLQFSILLLIFGLIPFATWN